MDGLELLRQALAAQVELCRIGHYDPFPAHTLGDTSCDIGGRKNGRRRFWLRDLLRSVSGEAEAVGLAPDPLLVLLQPTPGPDLRKAVAAALVFLDRLAIRRERAETAADKTSTKKRKQRKQSQRNVTEIQRKTVEVVAECKGNFSKAAKRLRKDRKTVAEAYKTALRKLGKQPIKYGTKTFVRDRRGQDDVADIDDQLQDGGNHATDTQDPEIAEHFRDEHEKQQRRYRRR